MNNASTVIGQSSFPTTLRQLWTTRLGFLFGAMGPATGFQIVTVLMLRFMTDDLAISAMIAGGILAGTKIVDAILDPLIGSASDRTRSRMGRRRPFLIAGTVMLPISVVLMFNVPAVGQGAVLAYVTLMLLVNSIGYSVYTVPYLASAAEITEDYHERSVLMSFRVYGGTMGLMVASSVAPWLLFYWGADRAGHGRMALVVGLVVLAVLLLSLRLIPEPEHDGSAQERVPFGERFAYAWSNRPFRAVVFAHVGFQVGVGAVMVCTAYFSRQVLHVTDAWLGWFLLAKTVGNLVSIPAWLWLARRFDKKRTYIVALALYGLLNISWLVAGPSEPIVFMFLRLFLIGNAMGGCVLLSYSVITDVMRYDMQHRGVRQEGILSGIISFVDKTFQAVGVALVGYLLSSMGYVASTKGASVTQPDSAITAIYIGFSAVPALAALVCIVAMLGYHLKQSDFTGPNASTPVPTVDPSQLP